MNYPEATVTAVLGGVVVHTAREEGDEIVQDASVHFSLEEAFDHIRLYFQRREQDNSPEGLDRHVL